MCVTIPSLTQGFSTTTGLGSSTLTLEKTLITDQKRLLVLLYSSSPTWDWVILTGICFSFRSVPSLTYLPSTTLLHVTFLVVVEVVEVLESLRTPVVFVPLFDPCLGRGHRRFPYIGTTVGLKTGGFDTPLRKDDKIQ